MTHDARLDFGRVVAWVDPNDTECGQVLFAHGCFRIEVDETGTELNNFICPKPPRAGLLVFEGVLEHTLGPDPDVYWSGEWRPLTHWELQTVGCGMDPFGSDS